MIFRRIRDLTVATIHEGLDQLENPVVMLNQYLRDMEREIKQAEESITKQMMLQASFLKEKNEAEEKVTKRTSQAELAMRAGDEDLARKALLSKKQLEEKRNYYIEITEQNEDKIKELKHQLVTMKEKYQQMRDKKYALMARANAVKTKEAMQKTMERFNQDKALVGFQRMEEKIVELETKTSLASDGYDSFKDSYVTLEQKDEIEKELLALKESITVKA